MPEIQLDKLNIIDKLRNRLIIEEEYRQYVYKDSVGILTIGIGRNVEQKGISKDEALYLLDNDICYFIKALQDKLSLFDKLDDTRKIILVDMAFNMGILNLLAFKNMLGYMEKGDYKSAADEMRASKWYIQVKNRAVRLAKMMETGVYENIK